MERQCWAKFKEEYGNKELWDIVRIARDPFLVKTTINALVVNNSNNLDTKKGIAQSFLTYNKLPNHSVAPLRVTSSTPF